jgi:hypothetical protein
MLNGAMVLMILAGIFGLPAAMCSGMCSSIGTASGANINAPEGQAIMDVLMYLSIAASLGSIVIGAMVKKFKKMISACACIAFAIIFAILLIQGNMLGLVSSVMLLIAGVMIFIAPQEQFAK